MALQLRQTMKQTQSAVMTQKLQQAIKLLQMSSIEIAGVIETEVEKNPFLEFEEADPAEGPSVSVTQAEPKESKAEAETSHRVDNRFADIFDMESGRSGGVSGPMPASRWQSKGGSAAPGNDGEGAEMRIAAGITLRDHLTEQMGLSLRDEDHLLVGQDLIDSLDDAGYLTEEVPELAARLSCTIAKIEATLAIMQTLDPPGVFARSLAECLALQLKDRDRFDPAMATLIENLNAVADGKHSWVAQQCGVDRADLVDMLAELRTLDPRPGLAFDSVVVQVVVPDVFVKRDEKGGLVVELNPELIPRILIDRDYYANVRSAARTKEEKAYLSERISTANWLVKSLDQRSQTILAVAHELVRQQRAFFDDGVLHMRPLTLSTVADVIGYHESTVSRVTANKHLSFDAGVLPMKYFFSAALRALNRNEDYSATSVRYMIKTAIDAEQPSAILSDDKIVKILRDQGIDIARRTVAKYREMQGIPSSVQRRRQKAPT
ncbi:MAG: RNA polymerase factor sigma-54 [Alphaproteobacteria bacterium]|nr:MAG: RNA polymerase factor sigma-54 [Alphaproteobacteria bacterium]